MRRLLAFALLLAGCAEPEDPAAKAGGAGDAEYRHSARYVYEALLIPSCDARPGYDRRALLAGEQARFDAYERGASARARSQLGIARIDLLHELEAMEKCENDSDPDRASLYLKDSKRAVSGGVGEMERLGPALAFTVPREAIEAPRSAEFRYRVRKLAQDMWMPCTDQARKDALLGPARAEIARFRDRLKGRPEGVNLALAEADAHYLQSITSVECSEAESLEGLTPGELASAIRAEVKDQIAAMEAGLDGRPVD